MEYSHRGSNERHKMRKLLVSRQSHISSIIFVFRVKTHKPMQNSKDFILFFFQSGNIGPRPEVVQLSQSLKQQLPK